MYYFFFFFICCILFIYYKYYLCHTNIIQLKKLIQQHLNVSLTLSKQYNHLIRKNNLCKLTYPIQNREPFQPSRENAQRHLPPKPNDKWNPTEEIPTNCVKVCVDTLLTKNLSK
jgi:hypothetical protein